ncbi:hypothetical protein Q4534_13760 [Cyclobacterium sp. 1_MG-2023]|uniref:hypothetical protein n=1 Tax=Cyclobacterium sp. 1_MG-2023 TaxID=3062681 RepID=UPI0026E27F8A|nr:hypothetical protein [Cyclobacterium sp. 1_MG-2023]MDO6438483.1 hypothetical protein [Cyclobacterium sp. 1_MG-2023]
MNAQGFLDLISKADDLENADLKKALKLQEKYPYFLAPKILAAKYEWDKASGASKTLLHWAAVVSPDRKRLKSLLTGTSPIAQDIPIETPPETHAKDSEAKEIVATIAPPVPEKTSTQKEEVSPDNTSRPKRDEILRRLEENLKKIKKTAPSPNENNQAHVKKKEEALEKTAEKKDEASKSKKKQKKPIAKKNKEAQQKLIDDFKEKPIRLTKDKLDEAVILPDLSEQSTHLNHSMLSESYAKLLVKQNKKNEAVEIYQKLILNFPKKRAYFADQIEKLRE